MDKLRKKIFFIFYNYYFINIIYIIIIMDLKKNNYQNEKYKLTNFLTKFLLVVIL